MDRDITEVQEQILENQEVMLLALSRLMLPLASTSNSNATVVNRLVDNYQHTRKLLGKDYVER